ncbi:lamin tail domain-containing protein [Flammeovirga agarivorans]|uniref:Lamin tail domain-containing protein n=1 Tax=Flammeovirga agarivorans TaxID=2726742 RepID=A0A7X8XU26_9BACT|nr:lamin tail domain-containing protein [Flammeovirga agarivorans]NLR89972.1 lamin tail domain-containing protein [Flammeovirga agarivorans]
MKSFNKYATITLAILFLVGCTSQVGEDSGSGGGQKIFLYDNPILGHDLYVLNYGHREVDGLDTNYYIIPNEVARVKDLDVAKNSSAANGDILSPEKLTEFEELIYFTGLETFRATSNELTTLDFSKCVKLKGIYINNNWLEVLNVDSLPLLEEIEFSSSSRAPGLITSMNLTNNINLIVFELEDHGLTALDVSKNVNLDEINVSGNTGDPITIDSLIYDQLSVAEGVVREEPTVELPDDGVVIQDVNFGRVLDSLGYANGPLSTGKYYLIPDDVAGVTTLDISNKGISKISEISYFTSLESLDASANSIDTIDVSTNNSLTILTADHSGSGLGELVSLSLPASIDSVDIYRFAGATVDITSCPNLVRFDAEQSTITSIDLSGNPELKIFRVRQYNSGQWDAGLGLTTIDFSNNPKLEDVYLFRNQLGASNDITWWDESEGSVLTSLDLGSNPNGTEATFEIPDFIFSTLTDRSGNVQSDAPPVDNSNLFISEYACSSSKESGTDFRNTYIEIYNPSTTETAYLSNYTLEYSSNGGDWGGEHTFSTQTLGPGEVLVIGRPEVNPSRITVDESWSSLTANGDDGIRLLKNNTVTDVIGTNYSSSPPVGTDPGDGWEVAGVTEATRNLVLWRKTTVTTPNTDWDDSRGTNTTDSEWIVSNVKEDYVNAGSPTDGNVPSQ